MRILFVTDLHGADLIFKKSLKAVETYKVSTLILAGDLTGKDIRPIIKRKDNAFLVNYRDMREVISASEVRNVEKELSAYGHYFFHCSEAEFELLKKDSNKILEKLDKKAIERVDCWANTIKQRIDLTKTTVFLTPGNDDVSGIDDVIKQHEKDGIYGNLEKPYQFPHNIMITVAQSNLTPWQTPREETEEGLEKIIREKIELLKKSPKKPIFNFHCPPSNTKLDLAPSLDKDHKPVISPGADNHTHVGSEAVRKIIGETQPVLALHGHIHESPGVDRIGKTICLNPGSEYWNGVLHGYIVDIDDEGNVSKYFRIEG